MEKPVDGLDPDERRQFQKPQHIHDCSGNDAKAHRRNHQTRKAEPGGPRWQRASDEDGRDRGQTQGSDENQPVSDGPRERYFGPGRRQVEAHTLSGLETDEAVAGAIGNHSGRFGPSVKMTHFFQDSLGGNTKTLMIACLSPASSNYDESLSTLRYANRAKNIRNKPRINEDPKDAMLREYQKEIEKLKIMLKQGRLILA